MSADTVQRRIVCAALRRADGAILCGPRHFDNIMRVQARLTGIDTWVGAKQGFVDQFGVFMGRVEAREVAGIAGQIIRRCGGDCKELCSENLY